MTNLEYFKQKIEELERNKRRISIKKDEPVRCLGYGFCGDCYRAVKDENELISCSETKLIEWAMSEHEEKLKPCPFCGNRAIVISFIKGIYNVVCNECKVSTGAYHSEKEAVKAWNRRENV